MVFGVKSDVGQVRKINQDSYLAMDGGWPIFAVADGMGGHKAGEVASALAIQALKEYQGQKEDIKQMLQDMILLANKLILKKQREDENCQGMGTTLTIAYVHEDQLYIGHVGDSRAYLYSNNQLSQITTDHSLVNELIRAEQITPEEANNHPQKHFLTQALGIGNDLRMEISCRSIERSDIILLCSDGLSNMLTDEEIGSILHAEGNLQEKTDVMVEIANAKGGLDNITIILFQPIS